MVEILVKTMKSAALLLLLLSMFVFAFGQAGPPGKTENVILITLDGARTQEVFGGLDLEVLKSKTKKGSVEETPLYKKYYAESPEKRREKLMPFFWGALMRQYGSIAGNRSLGSAVMTTNKMWFSYPGYSEILTGQAHDDVINSNDKKRNPYPSVLEFLKRKLNLDAKRVAAFASWDVMDFIAEHEAGSVTSNAGYDTCHLIIPTRRSNCSAGCRARRRRRGTMCGTITTRFVLRWRI
jgi:hypothetical protein